MAQPTVSLHVSELESRLGTPLVVRGSRRVSPTAAGTLDIGLIALPQPPVRDLVVTHWRNDPMMAFVPPRWQAPKAATPKWLAAQPLIFNDATTRRRGCTG